LDAIYDDKQKCQNTEAEWVSECVGFNDSLDT